MKEGKEKKREGKGGTERGREGGKEATNALQRLTAEQIYLISLHILVAL